MKNPIKIFRDREKRFTELEAIAQGTEFLTERIAELEHEMMGWRELGAGLDTEFSRSALTVICQQAFLYYLKNPLITRAVYIQTSYVFGSGLNIQAESPEVDAVVQDFLDKNKMELWTQQALEEKENELQLYANLFFTFFPGKETLKVRMIPFDEILAKINNPEDSKDTWFYVRSYIPKIGQIKTILYPDWKYIKRTNEATVIKNAGYADKEIMKDVYVYHVATNKIGKMQFGVSEVYAAMDWAKAYKEFLENWITIVKSYARFAWSLTSKTKEGGRAAGGKMATSGTHDKIGDIAIMTKEFKLEPLKTSGATVSIEDGRRLLLMVCAATGIYEHYFGDPSTGNLATSTTMERPMELKFQGRQSFWTDIYDNMMQYCIDWAVKYGKLPGNAATGELGKGEDGEELSRLINIRFPEILQHETDKRVGAIVSAATLNGGMFAGTLDAKITTRMLLQALEQDNIKETMETLFPEEPEGEPTDGEQKPEDSMESLKIVKKLNQDIREILKKNDIKTEGSQQIA